MSRTSLSSVLKNIQTRSQFSGMALAVAYGQEPTETYVAGEDTRGNALVEDSLFPAASITKLGTALAILRLWDQGYLSIDDELIRHLPEAAAAKPGVILRRLLSHSAGLPELPESTWEWEVGRMSWPIFAQSVLKVEPVRNPGTKVWYVDTNYGLLGLVIERITGLPLSKAMPELVFEPLGIEAYQGVEPPGRTIFIKDPGDAHAGTPLEIWNTAAWRTWGEPWGGLVITPAGTLALLRAFLGYPAGFLKPETVAASTQDQTGGLGGGFPWQEFPHCPWGLGPMLFMEGMGHWAFSSAPGGTLGHVGYSGCAVFAHPPSQVSWAIHGTITAADPGWEKTFAEINAAMLA